jgi:hypothetical protein
MNQALTAIVEQAAATLGAPAWIVNTRGTVLASSEGRARNSAAQRAQDSLRMDGHRAWADGRSTR